MSTVVINGTSYTNPDQGAPAPWGDDLHDIVDALAAVSNSTVGPADITTTSFSLANNQSSASNVTGASFDTSVVRSFSLNYSIYRSTSVSEESETGILFGTYKSNANTWDLSQQYGGSSGIVFSITTGGQIQYTSTNLSGTSYSGKLKFNARAFLQA